MAEDAASYKATIEDLESKMTKLKAIVIKEKKLSQELTKNKSELETQLRNLKEENNNLRSDIERLSSETAPSCSLDGGCPHESVIRMVQESFKELTLQHEATKQKLSDSEKECSLLREENESFRAQKAPEEDLPSKELLTRIHESCLQENEQMKRLLEECNSFDNSEPNIGKEEQSFKTLLVLVDRLKSTLQRSSERHEVATYTDDIQETHSHLPLLESLTDSLRRISTDSKALKLTETLNGTESPIVSDFVLALQTFMEKFHTLHEADHVLRDGMDRMTMKCEDLESLMADMRSKTAEEKRTLATDHENALKVLRSTLLEKEENILRFESIVEESREMARALEREKDTLQAEILELRTRAEEKETFLMDEAREMKLALGTIEQKWQSELLRKEGELASLKEERTILNNEVNMLQGELKDLQALEATRRTSEENSTVDADTPDTSVSTQTVEKLEATLKEKVAEIETLRDSLVKLEADLETANNRATSVVHHYHTESMAKRLTIEDYSSAISNEQPTSDSETRIHELSLLLEQRNAEVENLKGCLQLLEGGTKDASHIPTQTELPGLTSVATSVESEHDQENLRAVVVSLQANLQEKDAEIVRLQAEVADLKALQDNLQDKMQLLEKEKLETESVAAREVENLHMENTRLQQVEMAALMEQIRALEQDNHLSLEKVRTLENGADAAVTALMEEKSELAAKVEALQGMEARLAELQTEHDNLLQELEATKTSNAETLHALQTANEEVSRMQDALQVAQERAQLQENETSEQIQALNAWKMEHEQLQIVAERDRQSLEEERQSLLLRIQDLEVSRSTETVLETLQTEKASLQHELEHFKGLQEALHRLKEEKEAMLIQMSVLQEEKKAIETAHENLVQQLHTVQVSLEEARIHASEGEEQRTRDCSALSEEVKSLQEEKERMLLQLQTLQEEKRALEAARENLVQQLQTMEASLEEVRTRASEAEEQRHRECGALSEEVKSLQEGKEAALLQLQTVQEEKRTVEAVQENLTLQLQTLEASLEEARTQASEAVNCAALSEELKSLQEERHAIMSLLASDEVDVNSNSIWHLVKESLTKRDEQLTKLQEENHKLADDYATLQSENQERERVLNEAFRDREAVSEHQLKCQELESQKEVLERRLHATEESQEALQSELRQLRSELDGTNARMTEAITKYEEQLVVLQAELCQKEVDVETLQKALNDLQRDYDSLEPQVQVLKEAEMKSQRKLEEKESLIVSLREELDTALKKCHSSGVMDLEFADLERVVMSQESKLEDREARLLETEQKLQAKSAELQQCEARLVALTEEHSRSTDKTNKMKQLLLKNKKDATELGQKLSRSQAEELTLRKTVEMLTTELEHEKLASVQVLAEKEKSEEKIRKMNRQHAQQVQTLENTVRILQSDVDALTQEKDELRQQFEQYKVKAQRSLREKSQHFVDVHAMADDKAMLEQLRNDMEQMRHKLEDLDEVNAILRSERETLLSQVAALQQRNESTRLELHACRQEWKDEQTRHESAQAQQCVRLKSAVEQLQKEKLTLQADYVESLRQVQAQHRAQVEKLESRVEQLEEENERVVHKLMEASRGDTIALSRRNSGLPPSVLPTTPSTMMSMMPERQQGEGMENPSNEALSLMLPLGTLTGGGEVMVPPPPAPEDTNLTWNLVRQMNEGRTQRRPTPLDQLLQSHGVSQAPVHTSMDDADSLLSAGAAVDGLGKPPGRSNGLGAVPLTSPSEDHTGSLKHKGVENITMQLQRKVDHLTELLSESEATVTRLTEQAKILKEEIRRQERNIERERRLRGVQPASLASTSTSQHPFPRHHHVRAPDAGEAQDEEDDDCEGEAIVSATPGDAQVAATTMEYLKNICLKFLLLRPGDERKRLVPVLTTLLSLSAQEKEQLLRIAAHDASLEGPEVVASQQNGWVSYLWGSRH